MLQKSTKVLNLVDVSRLHAGESTEFTNYYSIPVPTRDEMKTILNGNANTSWYDVSDLDSLKPNVDGTGTITLGAAVAYIADQSGNNRHLTNSNAAQRPTLIQENNRYLLSFDGFDDVLYWNTFNVNQGTTYYMLLAMSRAVNSGAAFGYASYKTSTRYMRMSGNSTGQRANIAIRGTGGNFTSTATVDTFPLSTYGVIDGQATPTLIDVKTPTGNTFQTVISGDTSNNAAKISLGGAPASAALTPHKIGGMVGFSGALSSDNRDKVRLYFT